MAHKTEPDETVPVQLDANGTGGDRKRVRALDSRGRPVQGLYVREGRYIAGASLDGRWTMHTLDADTLTDARRERESWLAGLREGRIAARNAVTVESVFKEWQDARLLSERTRKHERWVLRHYLGRIADRRVQDVTASEIARVLRELRDAYAPWTCVGAYRILAGTFAHAFRRGIIARSPIDGLAPTERPKQRNARDVAVLDAATLAKLVAAGTTERWRAALGLAALAGLRLGEVRALRWADVDLPGHSLYVRRSLLPSGTAKAPKTAAGVRTVPVLPALERLLLAWRKVAPHTRPTDFIIGTADGHPVAERNLRRALDDAKTAAGLDHLRDRLSWHALRHTWVSLCATDLELPATTLAALAGHTDSGFTLRVYGADARDDSAVVADVLARAKRRGVGG